MKKLVPTVVALLFSLVQILPTLDAAERPNVLWITSEDNSPYLGCYGDLLAHTPNLDRLASQGVRYRNAFANAPVCSVARTTLITGMYATTIGGQNHRSNVAIPKQFQLYPEHLRAAGYYCTNNSKTDYNVIGRREVWNESSKDANYNNRQTNQPFFAVFNLTSSHESQVAPRQGKSNFRIPIDKVTLPPYHPDTPIMRSDWANYYDQITQMDQQVGQLLDKLERDGLADETIVFYYSDHGGGLPRGKRNIHDSGTRVPLILRFPEKWAYLAPAKPGEWVEDPVSFVDLPVTLFSLCNVSIPMLFEGRPFLGSAKVVPRENVFLYRGRMDERYDTVRAVRDAGFRYIRNYSPHRPWGQQYSYPFQVLPSMQSWYEEFISGRCNETQASYWKSKPPEEFYAIESDPFEIQNLISDPRHSASIAKLRAALRDAILASRDTGFIPEGMIEKLSSTQSIYDYAHSQEYPLERIVDLANKTSDGNLSNLPAFIVALGDPHPVIRYWAATGCLILKDRAAPAKADLLKALNDTWADVRIVVAEAIGQLGEQQLAISTIREVLVNGNQYESLAALNTLDVLRTEKQIPLSVAQDLLRDLKFVEPADRIARFILGAEPDLTNSSR